MLIGLVGKPSCGKSTFFKAATLAEVDIAAYPFTTIKANHGVGYVKIDCIDKEFGVQCNPSHGFCLNHHRFVPIDIMDVAGLVKGASEGKGLGNQFLDDLRHEDVKFLEDELDKWYYNLLMKVWRGFARKAEIEHHNFSDAVVKQFSGLKVNEDHVKFVLRKLNFTQKPSLWVESQIMSFAFELRSISKPMIIAANKIDLPKGRENYEKLRMEFPHKIIFPCSADSELALRQAFKAGLIYYVSGEKAFENKKDLTDQQKLALKKIKTSVLDVYTEGTGVQSVLNAAVFGILGYLAIFPASANKLGDSKGNILPDCFLLPPNSTALDFAYYLHTDFGKNFIKAIDARTKRAVGKDYLLKNRDALEIVTR